MAAHVDRLLHILLGFEAATKFIYLRDHTSLRGLVDCPFFMVCFGDFGIGS